MLHFLFTDGSQTLRLLPTAKKKRWCLEELILWAEAEAPLKLTGKVIHSGYLPVGQKQ